MKRILTILALASLWTDIAAADNGAFGGSGGPPPAIYHALRGEWPYALIFLEASEYNRLYASVHQNGGKLQTEVYERTLTVWEVDGSLVTEEETPRMIISVP